jgi:cytochrome c peroxidase
MVPRHAFTRRTPSALTGPSRLIAAAALLAIVTAGFAMRVGPVEAQATQTIDCPTGFDAVDAVIAAGPPFIPMTSLKSVANPIFPVDPVTGVKMLRPDLTEYIANASAAIQLGKAFYWDMQAGSDNATACGSCHFNAGADSRSTSQLNPGPNQQFVDSLQSSPFGPNYALQPFDFPFTDGNGDRTDNGVGSQGIRKSTFVNVTAAGVEKVTAVPDPVFQVNGFNVRQVGGIQSPSVINAVFNHRNFWNGRAQPDFNGVNPFGARDINARVWVLSVTGSPTQIDIRIPDAGLASQAVGPPMNELEMAAAGRTFPHLGKKLLLRKPLGLQTVHPNDSVLGALADTTVGAKGLRVSYASLIQQAFKPKWWNSTRTVNIGGQSFTMMQANFPLYWGLSLMAYEATLVSDDTPIDRYLASRTIDPVTGQLSGGDLSAFDPLIARLAAEGTFITRDSILAGLALFELPVAPETIAGAGVPSGFGAGCTACHLGAELTSASVRNLVAHGLEPGDVVFRNAGFDGRMERMFMQLPPVPAGSDQITYNPATYEINVTRTTGVAEPAPLPVRNAVYDAGWYDIGVRPTVENIGLGGKDPFGNFLSWTQMFQALPYPAMVKVPGGGLGCATTPPGAPATSPFAGEVLNPLTGMPVLAGPLTKTGDNAIAGSFKTPSLRNVELTGPYLHNGGKATLRQVVEMYDGGGDFRDPAANPNRSPAIMPLHLTPQQEEDLVSFLVALTDERVRWKKAPFDHPELIIPHGIKPATGKDTLITLPASGADGAPAPLGRFLNLKPMQ